MILTVTPNPCVDKTVYIESLVPGTFMRSNKCTCIAGGKGTNVSRATKQMGRPTRAMVVVGGHTGHHVVDMITIADQMDCFPAWVASQTRTITTVLEQQGHRQTAFFEPGSRVTHNEYEDILSLFPQALIGAKVVTFSGTVSDPSIRGLYKALIPIAKSQGVLTILDSHGAEFAQGIEAVPYMVKPNLAELQELAGSELNSQSAIESAVEALHAKGIQLIVLSLGKEGAFVSRGSERFQVVPPRIEEVNAVGSGDSLVAGFAIGLMEGMSLQEMAKLGCAMGTANAMSWEIGHFTREEVDALLPKVRIVFP
ncbi:MAG TPA: 1-phosphofructokinase family hexose kinase [Candidatus Hydrogenedentes bacterium]|nr:1-phosphofructokinase family hexose kinase [Candidatus Hydrogenedentota bacterium]